jgi:hypothetical protein
MNDAVETTEEMGSSREETAQDVESLFPGEECVHKPGPNRDAAQRNSEAERIAAKVQPGRTQAVNDPADQEDWFESVSREQSSTQRRQCCQMTYLPSRSLMIRRARRTGMFQSRALCAANNRLRAFLS